MFRRVGTGAEHPFEFMKLTDTDCAPATFQETVMKLVPVPAVMLPPAETAQV
jgi:hypothetical protein